MRKEESETDLGAIGIHKNVIASIAAIAAMEIEGVKGIGRAPAGIFALITPKKYAKIKVRIDKNEDVRIEVPLIVKYGFNIPDVAGKVQENIHNALEKTANLSTKDISINIQGITKD
jgi:uncharacterized alkaline shock family protein YloU